MTLGDYFVSAAVAVDSSHMTASSSVDSVRLQILSMGTCRQCGSALGDDRLRHLGTSLIDEYGIWLIVYVCGGVH